MTKLSILQIDRGRILKAAITLVVVAIMAALLNSAHGHPEDDFCDPDSGIDPQLCLQLAELNSGEADLTHPLLNEDGSVRSATGSAVYFLNIGVRHILPGGTDHILFVLALFLASQSFRNLAVQISVFTVAHTVTLGLTAAGIIEPPSSIVEPLIALSIVVVAIENLFVNTASNRRLLIIFGFGLFHGMGFAGFIREIGLPAEQFWPSLIGFNVGVEIGQLAVVLSAALLAIPTRRVLAATNYTYRQVVVSPLSLIIAAIGVYWFAARIFF